MGRDIYDIETTVYSQAAQEGTRYSCKKCTFLALVGIDDKRQANGNEQEAYAAVLEATTFYPTGGSEMGAIRLRHLA